MKIATKTLASLLIITMLTLSTSAMAGATGRDGSGAAEIRENNRLQKMTRRHDRKMELQASILDMTPDQLKQELKTSSLEQIIKKHGFKTKADFYTAVAGKVKDELKKRGWGDEKIQRVLDKRLSRLENRS